MGFGYIEQPKAYACSWYFDICGKPELYFSTVFSHGPVEGEKANLPFK